MIGMSKREDKRREDEEDDDDEEDISSSEGDDEDSESEMSESADGAQDAKGSGKPNGGVAQRGGSERALQNQPFDEAVDLSESEDSVSESKDSPKKKAAVALKNQPFDEALELSGSVQDLESPVKMQGRHANEGASRMQALNANADEVGNEVRNKPFDEEVELSDSGESVDTQGQPSPDRQAMKESAQAGAKVSSGGSGGRRDDRPAPLSTNDRASNAPQAAAAAAAPKPSASAPAPRATESKAPEAKKKPQQEAESSSEESDSDEDDDDDDEEEEDEEAEESQSNAGGPGTSSAAHAAMMSNAAAYKESDYAHLKVSGDIRELFQYIGRFKPQEIELETRLKCFIPEYIPAVGDMDAFLKIPRPDGESDHLGLKMLDEPSLNQSDATVLDLQLRSTSKKKHGDLIVRSIDNAEKSPKEIDRWIKSIADLHRSKPPPQVHYSKSMPDIESLMQVWPEEFEELLGKIKLPRATMDISLEQYIRVICAILDIPVYKNVYESLHVLFTLYLEFRSNQHFMNYDDTYENQQAPPPFTSRIGTSSGNRHEDSFLHSEEGLVTSRK